MFADMREGATGRPLELNPFAYAANNPLRWTDPTGMFIDFPGGDGFGGMSPIGPSGPTCATAPKPESCPGFLTRIAQRLGKKGQVILLLCRLAGRTNDDDHHHGGGNSPRRPPNPVPQPPRREQPKDPNPVPAPPPKQ